MKIKLLSLFSLLFFASYGVYAQYYPFYGINHQYFYIIDRYEDWDYNARKSDKIKVYNHRIENKISGSRSVNINHKGDTTAQVVRKFNKKGRLLAVDSKSKKGGQVTLEQEFLNDTLLSKYTNTKKKNTYSAQFKYDEKGRNIRIEGFKNGKQQGLVEMEYEGGNLVKQFSTDFSKRKPKTRMMLNTYDETGKLIKTAYYKNDELERTWEYDCSERGLAVKPKNAEEGVPSSSSCSWKEESSDGSYTIYYRRLMQKSIYLTESHFTKDSVMVRSKTFNEKDRLTYETINYDNSVVSKSYKRNGKLRSYTSRLSDPTLGEVASSNIFYGWLTKFPRSSQKRYDERGLLVEWMNSYNGRQRKAVIMYDQF